MIYRIHMCRVCISLSPVAHLTRVRYGRASRNLFDYGHQHFYVDRSSSDIPSTAPQPLTPMLNYQPLSGAATASAPLTGISVCSFYILHAQTNTSRLATRLGHEDIVDQVRI
ncbi:hypothetical protein QTP88_024014 [Uroleucon formosanum]